MKNKIFKIIMITIIICYSTVLYGCTFSIRLGISKTGTTNNGQAMNNNINTRAKEPDNTEEKDKLLKDITVLSDRIIKMADNDSIKAVLEDYSKVNSSSVSSVYFATVNGGFYLFPNQKLPEDYDARTRTWYKQAIENKVYVSQYQDATNGNNILTVAKPISKDNENIGVIGIDKFIEQ